MRYEKMLNVMISPPSNATILDVGCGFAGLMSYINDKGLSLSYTGIDIAENMLAHAMKTFPEHNFITGDILSHDIEEQYDYVVCNGILTQKLNTSQSDMNHYMEDLVSEMFKICNIGIAFNVMTDRVNFRVDNLFYKSPEELFTYCLNNVTRHIKIDHAYPMYEYTMYLYKDGV
jgi:SAM-dependent methyltransferase